MFDKKYDRPGPTWPLIEQVEPHLSHHHVICLPKGAEAVVHGFVPNTEAF